ncbi:LppX_LprAFG lipoprotein [Candidatus Spongiisocius sp.]|uniref:LppX_LprAFG lipoprotein n=1 Tax=Candidatus Spongiisocius sp. TaxID=3101273 RepID=UPI003B5B85A0
MNIVRSATRTGPLVALAMSLVFLAAACGTEPEPTPETEPEMSLEDILARTGENLVALSTAKFQMIDEKETGAKFFGATLKNVNGEVQSPDSAKLVVEIESAALGFAEVQIVAVGDEAFMKFSAGAPWNPLPLDQVPFNFVGLGITLSDLLPLVQNAAIAGEESLGSGPAVLVEGNLVSEDLSTLITSADSGHAIDLTLWIGKADQVLRQIRIAGQIFDDDGPETSRLIILSDYGAPVEIQLPETASGT